MHLCVEVSVTPFPGVLHFTFDPYLIMPSIKQDGIKYHFLSLPGYWRTLYQLDQYIRRTRYTGHYWRSNLYGHMMLSRRPAGSDGWEGRMARESQGNLCFAARHDIYIYIYIYIYIVYHKNEYTSHISANI